MNTQSRAIEGDFRESDLQRVPSGSSANDRADGEAPYRVFAWRNFLLCIGLFLFALITFLVLEYRFYIYAFGVSNAPHFIYQAESFLHGRWDIDLPPSTTDVISLHGKNYIVYPPFPALLLMPFVAVYGLHTSDVFFTTVAASLNLPLLYMLLEQVRSNGLIRRPWWENLVIALLLFYGSINLWLSLGGRMWFTASVVCMACTLISLLFAFRRHYGWAAVFLSCAFFSRTTLLLAFPFLLYLTWQDAGRAHDLERFARSLKSHSIDKIEWNAVPWRRLAAPVLIMAVTIVLYALRNFFVFGSPFETGYDILIHQHYPIVTNGTFCPCYVPTNIIANFFTFPRIMFSGPFDGAFDRHPIFDMLNNGFAVSVFLTTPPFLFLFWRNRRMEPMRVALWVTIGFVVVAVLLFHASGWRQFGARYLYDGYPFAFLLLALNDMRVDWRFVALGVVAIGINYLGADQFWAGYMFQL